MMRQMIKLIIGLSEHHKKTEPEKTAKLAENNANRATTKQNIIDLTIFYKTFYVLSKLLWTDKFTVQFFLYFIIHIAEVYL